MKNEFLFCPLGGSGEIGMNMNLFGYGQPADHKWIMVDIGVTFADDTIPGIDLIYPDPGFIQEKKEKIEKEIEKELIQAQKEIAELKKNSISDIHNISKEIAANIIENISGDKLNESSIKAVVEEISKKNVGKYL